MFFPKYTYGLSERKIFRLMQKMENQSRSLICQNQILKDLYGPPIHWPFYWDDGKMKRSPYPNLGKPGA